MKKSLALLLLFASHAIAGEAKPNVLMIVVDDLKPVLGCYGDKHAVTPNFDRLAAGGAVLTNAYANQAVCGPSRCSLFSGLRPDRTRVHDLQTDFYEVCPGVITLPALLRKNGYATAGCGKLFHGGASDGIMETEAFDVLVHDPDLPYNPNHPKPALFYQAEEAQKAFAHLTPEQRTRWKLQKDTLDAAKANLSSECLDLPDDAYIDGALTTQTISFIDKLSKGDKPFFISVGFKSPHLPFIAPKKYWDLYDRSKLPSADVTQPPAGSPQFAGHTWGELRAYNDIPKDGPLTPDQARAMVHGYYASTSYVDAQIGKLLDHLEKSGLSKNTLIILWGDHGWHLGDHGWWCKHTNYEQATRTVLMASGPGIQPNKKSAALSELVDVFATVCDLTGVTPPANLDSRSLVPVLSGKSDQHRAHAQSQFPRGNGTMGYAFRTARHRYVVWVSNPTPKNAPAELPAIKAEELYDYTADPKETKNLAGNPENAALIKSFRDKAATFIREQHAASAAK